MKKILIAMLVLAASLALLISCAGDEPSVTTSANTNTNTNTTATVTTTAPIESDKLVIAENGVANYVIVYSKNKTNTQRGFAMDLSRAVKNVAGIEPQRTEDTADAVAKEILIGDTNRPETAVAKEALGDNDYIIKAVNEKIVIYSIDETLYDLILYKFGADANGDGIVSLDKDYSFAGKKNTIVKTDIEYAKDKSFSLDFAFDHKESKIVIILGEEDETAEEGYRGYVIEITEKLVILYKHGTIIPEYDSSVPEEERLVPDENNGKFEYARRYTEFEAGKRYEMRFDFDGEYFRFFVMNDAEGYTPWPEFEVKLLGCDGYKFTFAEKSGYALSGVGTFGEITVADYKSDVEGVSTYKNNVVPGYADPDIIYYNGYYYMYTTGKGYPVFKSTNLSAWKQEGTALPDVSWNVNKNNMWAPDVEYIDGKFYMAVSLGEAGFGIAVSDTPTGPFVCQGTVPILKKTIDGHIFVDDDGKTYLYYTSWEDRNGAGRTYGIYGMELEDDHITPKWETEKLIITPTVWWESSLGMGGIVEAPYMLKKDGLYYLVYSGSHYQANYAVGYATSKNPLSGFKKTEDSPILYRTNDARGTGHCSIFETKDGTLAMVYHVHYSQTQVAPRHVAIDPVRFVPKLDGGYRLEAYGPTTTKRPLSLFK